MIIKVCGITGLDDALCAVEHGVNALGFNFYAQSPRYISADQAAEIIEGLDSKLVLSVGVVVHGRENGKGTVLPKSLQAVQLHGIADPADLPNFGRRLFVAISAGEAFRFPDHEIVIDSSWGTGRLEDWDSLMDLRRPYILSGGLTPENVARAIEKLHPAGVDVCSGVESGPGRKDREKLKRFMSEIRRVYGEL